MKKTLNINLGGFAFIIDENAFELLHNYLEALKRKFKSETERDEILHDIEARIAEMLNAKLAGRKEVISIVEVQAVVDAMGKPEDIAGEDTEPVASATAAEQSTTYTTPPVYTAPVKKRLFRDADDAKVGGVIAGLCHYFGINDPAWMRIAAIILIFVTSGAIILLYLLLLIVVPKALTSAEKLQMKGEPVNINTIEKEIKDAATRTGESINGIVNDNSFFEKMWNLVVVVTLLFLKFIAGIIIFVALAALTLLLLALFGVTVVGNEILNSAPHLLVNNPGIITMAKIGAALFIGAPLIGIVYAALRGLLGKGRGRAPWLKWVLLAAWWVGVFMIGYVAVQTGMEFKTTGTKRQQVALMQPANGTLTVQLTDSAGVKLPITEDEDDKVNPGGIIIHGHDITDGNEPIIVDEPSLQLMPSVNDSFYVETIVNAQGRNKADAIKNTTYAPYGFSQTDSMVNLPGLVILDRNGKYRAQNVKVRIHIPEGKQISFADNIDRWAATVKGDGSYDDTYFANTTWTVENGKVKCIRGENHFNAEKAEDRLERKADELEEKVQKLEEKLEDKGGKDKGDY